MRGRIPAGWARVALRDALEGTGTVNPTAQPDREFRYIDIEAIDNRRQQITGPKRLLGRDAPSRARRQVRQGDILFSLVRPYLKNVAVVPVDMDGEVASTAFFVARPIGAAASDFLFYQLVQERFVNSLPTYGSSPPAARDLEFMASEILLAPLSEQHRIVAKLDELFSELDAGVAALERAQASWSATAHPS